ncbi:hypothetical protein [Hyalangium rubrum]|uniref:DUF262 domain-containing protein n=1 Tax=Hyalangium rubrum TaxID=3103134 RepID=A0ABU5HDY2_9BACT|nr:hypothetical protein [Hyalangium sp. s54d21]MDY7231683.1 hypothetical protein [Hyalangium sp. s54d21]
MSTEDYLSLTNPAYQRRGSIEGQREALQTSSAVRIRDRMASDLRAGAVLPPVVVGILLPHKRLTQVPSWTSSKLRKMLAKLDPSAVSIIDGMQRTTVLLDHQKELKGRELRVELWLADKTSSLTYRMLILNTGQVPWNLRRQIEVINASLIREIRSELESDNTPPEIYSIDNKSRRFNPGEYQANDVVEMYIAFGLRKAQVDKESVLADQFSRLDMIEAVSTSDFLPHFIEVFRQMIALDRAFGQMPGTPKSLRRFNAGRSLFDSQPACVGFMAAAAQKIYGRPGANRSHDEQLAAVKNISDQCNKVSKYVSTLNEEELSAFLDFATLNEVLDKPSSKIGDFERTLFTDAFRLFLEEGPRLKSMTACWRVQ